MPTPWFVIVAGSVAIAVAAAVRAAVPAADVRDGASGYTVACALAEQPGMRSCAELPAATACAREADFASRPSSESTGMTFVNRSDRAVYVYWLDFRGYRRLYRTLAPGGQVIQQTYIGHNWLITTADQCIGIFKAAPESLAFF